MKTLLVWWSKRFSGKDFSASDFAWRGRLNSFFDKRSEVVEMSPCLVSREFQHSIKLPFENKIIMCWAQNVYPKECLQQLLFPAPSSIPKIVTGTNSAKLPTSCLSLIKEDFVQQCALCFYVLHCSITMQPTKLLGKGVSEGMVWERHPCSNLKERMRLWWDMSAPHTAVLEFCPLFYITDVLNR